MKDFVYAVNKFFDDYDDNQYDFLGVYSSYEKALSAVKQDLEDTLEDSFDENKDLIIIPEPYGAEIKNKVSWDYYDIIRSKIDS